VDPDANCDTRELPDMPNCTVDISTVGDGECDEDNNNEARIESIIGREMTVVKQQR